MRKYPESIIIEYSKKANLYKKLAEKVKDIIEESLEYRNINYVNVECRGKSIDSLSDKVKNKEYKNLEEIHDLAGIRIISYVNSDLEKIVAIIKKLFNIDENNSQDKSKILGSDKVGYRSIHFVASLPKDRLELLEYKKFKNLKFEIQIRTILQHAWAEIEHDRNYKFSGVLPNKEKRQFSLLAGVLELADNEFDSISKSIEAYSKNVSEKTKSGQLDIPINSTSIRQFLKEMFGDIKTIGQDFGNDESLPIEELHIMNLKTLQDFKNIIPKDYKNKLISGKIKTNFCAIIRDVLMIYNVDTYFKKAWRNNWTLMTKDLLFFESYIPEFKKVLKKYNISTEK